MSYRYIPITTENGIATTLAVQQLLNDRKFVRGNLEWLSAQARIIQEMREATTEKWHYLRLTVEDHAKLADVAADPEGDADSGERYGELRRGDGVKIPAGPIIYPHLQSIKFAGKEEPPKPEEPEQPSESDGDANAAE